MTPVPGSSSDRSEVFRTLFVYGPMMAEECITALLGRVPKRRPATLPKYVRCCKKGADQVGVCTTHRGLVAAGYPAVTHTGVDDHSVDGCIYERLRPKELRALDYYEDDAYERISVHVEAESPFGGREAVECLVYTWPTSAANALDIRVPWNCALLVCHCHTHTHTNTHTHTHTHTRPECSR